MFELFHKIVAIAVDQVFPLQCVACKEYGFALCPTCAQSAIPVPLSICLTCGRPQVEQVAICLPCQRLKLPQNEWPQSDSFQSNGFQSNGSQSEMPLLFSRSATLFTSPIREAVHGLKYEKRTELAEIMARYLYASFQGYPWVDLYNLIDVVIPVPLHAKRFDERGYNQAELLAEAFAKFVNIPFSPKLLERYQHTDSQVGKDIAQRQHNVANAFRATNNLDNLVVLLIDDVCTTGATLQACAKALKNAGVLQVYALTLATPQIVQ